MLANFELKTLAAWCAARAVRWRPLSGDHTLSLLLEQEEGGQSWHRVVLRLADSDLLLMTESGERLASASELHGLLDALEGGIGEIAPSAPTGVSARQRQAQAAYVL